MVVVLVIKPPFFIIYLQNSWLDSNFQIYSLVIIDLKKSTGNNAAADIDIL